jgi:hypothetical protein|nr:MAG TPA: hypothetical protein [Caudoviricetes sp.]
MKQNTSFILKMNKENFTENNYKSFEFIDEKLLIDGKLLNEYIYTYAIGWDNLVKYTSKGEDDDEICLNAIKIMFCVGDSIFWSAFFREYVEKDFTRENGYRIIFVD